MDETLLGLPCSTYLRCPRNSPPVCRPSGGCTAEPECVGGRHARQRSQERLVHHGFCELMLLIDAFACIIHEALAALHLVYLLRRPQIAPLPHVCIVGWMLVRSTTEQEKVCVRMGLPTTLTHTESLLTIMRRSVLNRMLDAGTINDEGYARRSLSLPRASSRVV